MSIYDGAIQDPRTIVKGGGRALTGGGDVLQDQLSFQAACVIVDNPGAGSVYLADAKRTIPGGVYGAVVPLPGVTTARATYSGGVPGDTVTLTFLDEPAPPSPGVTQQINIINTPSVSIAANQSIGISGTPTVAIAANQSIQISGTPTVILGASSATVGSINAINSTVTVAGTISISSGSVSITAGTVNVQNVPSTQLQVQQPQVNLGSLTAASGATQSTTLTLPTGAHGLAMLVKFGNIGAVQLQTQITIVGVTSGVDYTSGLLIVTSGLGSIPSINNGGYYIPIASGVDSQVTVTLINKESASATLYFAAALDPQGVTVIPQPSWGAPLTVTMTDRAPRQLGINYEHAAGTQQVSAPASGTAASIVISAIANRFFKVYSARWSIFSAGAATTQKAQLLDGATAIQTLYLGCSATSGTGSVATLSRPAITTVTNNLTVNFGAGVASVLESCDVICESVPTGTNV